jgi:hypothetical protein
MEALYQSAVPPDQRHGMRFVFRQGSPLDPGALRQVAATRARAIIVCGDSARCEGASARCEGAVRGQLRGLGRGEGGPGCQTARQPSTSRALLTAPAQAHDGV